MSIRVLLISIIAGLLWVIDAIFLLIISYLHYRTERDERRLLVVRLDAIGDAVLWLPSAYALRELFPNPEWKLTLVSNQTWSRLVESAEIFDEVWPVDTNRLLKNPLYRFQIFRKVRAAGFAQAIQPTYSREPWWGDAVVRASAAPQRIGSMGDCSNMATFMKGVTDSIYTRLLGTQEKSMSELRRNQEFVSGLGGEVSSVVPKLKIHETLKEPIAKLVKGLSYFVVFPGASKAYRCWPPEYFAQLADRLVSLTGWRTVICGSSSDQPLAKAVIAKSTLGAAVDLTGVTDLTDFAQVLAGAQLVISNETSAVHLSAAVGTPSVCVLGGGHYGRFLPYDVLDPENVSPRVVSFVMPCFYCNWQCIYQVPCGQPVPCIAQVSVDSVWNMCLEIIESGRVHPGTSGLPCN